ncbi:helix-hairpin-helix domain-containing protein [Celeribacter naphthalenivorans]|uniref:helix-hairpin-helix domain-containing protein n=1 Tax=Celeribacter naphthalenivorans TaxID=1614694 RepID=UPI001CFA876E|nr:helix-hairpin-helix domain-containing protein [Celeribacter naphthalenivorans]
MTDAQQGKTPKIGLIAAICGVIAFLALMLIAGYSTGASVIVGVLVAFLVAILLWIGWYEETTEAPEASVGHPEADVSASGLMATSGIGDEPVSAADEIAVEPHAADTREVRSAAAAATPEADPVAEPVAEVEEKTEAAPVAFADVPEAAVVAEPDDLKSIKGVGPKIEVQLHERGITTFAQVAALSADEIEALGAALKGTSAAQLTKWAEQAKILATGGDTEFSKRVKDGDVY